jgi:PAS domain S-box-containing protein
VAAIDVPDFHGTDVARLLALIDGIGAVIYEVDATGWVRFVSRPAVEFFGYPKERWLSQPGFWHSIAYRDDRWRVKDHFANCAKGDPHEHLEYRVVTADGRIIWVRQALSAARDAAGKIDSLRSVMVRIDEPGKADRELLAARRQLADRLADMAHLRELTERIGATLELGPLLKEIVAGAVAIQGADMGIVRLYEPARQELRIVASVGVPGAFIERYGRVSAEDSACGLTIKNGVPLVIEDVERDPAVEAHREPARLGGYRAKYSTLMPMRSGEPLGTIETCFRRPHESSGREAELVESFARQAAGFIETARFVEALRAADRRKDEALAALAHEIRNPLSAILSGSQVMRLEAQDGSRCANFCDMVTRQTRLLARLANELVETCHGGDGETSLQIESIEIGTAIDQAIETVMPLVNDRLHQLVVTPPPAVTWVHADPFRLEQILVNLLVNACHYTEPGGSITLDAWREEEKVAIRVRDTGVGISPEMLPRIFERFVRAPSESSLVVRGLGLGLALVKSFAERQGGDVTVMSDGPGRGSAFVVRLPAADGDGDGATRAPARNPYSIGQVPRPEPDGGWSSC